MYKNELDMILQRMVKAYRAVYGENIVKIILYGSYARGDYDHDSDIDIALLLKCSRMEAKKYDDALAEISTVFAIKYFAIVNFVSLPYGEFTEKRTWYRYFKNIDKEGEVLYG